MDIAIPTIVVDHRTKVLEQLRARPGDARADGPDGTGAHLGRLGITETDDLREDEGGSPVVVESPEEVDELDEPACLRGGAFRRLTTDALVQPSAAAPLADRVGHRPPGDREQPGPGRGLAPEMGQGAQHPDEDVVGEVVGPTGFVGESGAEPPDVAVGGAGEGTQGHRVAVTGGDEELGEDAAVRFSIHGATDSSRPELSRRLVRLPGMQCEHAREAMSALIDGEDPGAAAEEVAAHLARCGACERWRQDLDARPSVVAMTAAPGEHVLPAVLGALSRERAAVEEERERRALAPWRIGLVVVAVTQPLLVLPSLVSAQWLGHAHDAREIGSWHLALAVGFLFAAHRPARAWGMLPLVAALVAALVVTAGIDMANGNAGLASELAHAVDVGGLACLWALSARVPRPAIRPRPV